MITSKLPAKIFVRWTDPQQDGHLYLDADVTPDSTEDGDLVGVYELVETKTMVTRTLQAPLPTADQARALRVKRRTNGPQRVARGDRR